MASLAAGGGNAGPVDLPFYTRAYVNIGGEEEPSLLQQQLDMLERENLETSGNGEPAADKFHFRVMSYNLLADYLLYANPSLYNHLPQEFLKWDYRCKNLVREIVSYLPSVLCVQEAEEGRFLRDIFPALESEGYRIAALKRRTGGESKCDCVAILYKSSEFTVVSTHTVELKRPTLNPILDRDNVACIAQFRPNGGGSSGSSGRHGCDLFVATTHLLFNPSRGDIKMAQIDLVCKEINAMVSRGVGASAKTAPPAIVLAGDFNSSPGSLVYDYVRRGLTGDLGSVDYRKVSRAGDMNYVKAMQNNRNDGRRGGGPSRKRGPVNRYFPEGTSYSHEFGDFSSLYDYYVHNEREERRSYDGLGEPWCTSYTRYSQRTTVDYIFFNQQITATARYNVPALDDLDEAQNGGLPNRFWSSDHVSLIGDFFLSPKPLSGVSFSNKAAKRGGGAPGFENVRGGTEDGGWPTLGDNVASSGKPQWPALASHPQPSGGSSWGVGAGKGTFEGPLPGAQGVSTEGARKKGKKSKKAKWSRLV